MKQRLRQLEFKAFDWGGKRRGAGRKPKGKRAGVPHAMPPELNPRHPLLVTLRAAGDVKNLRTAEIHGLLQDLIEDANERDDFQVVEYSLQTDHVHLVVESDSKESLSKAMHSLASRFARGANRLLGRRGPLFPDRYHAEAFTTPTSVRLMLIYVLGNGFKHGVWRCPGPDPFSSGHQFDGWLEIESAVSRWLPRARTWLLAEGWHRKLGRISIYETPKPRR